MAPFKGLKFYVICSTFYVQFWGVEFIEFVAFIKFIEFIGFFGFESKVYYLLFIGLVKNILIYVMPIQGNI